MCISIVVTRISRTFSSCKSENLYPLTPFVLLPTVTGNHPPTFFSMNLTTLDTSCKWNHTVCLFLGLVYFT